MTRDNTPPPQQARETSLTATDTRQTHENHQGGGRRDGEHGPRRNEGHARGAQPPEQVGEQASEPTLPEAERGDARRPYKRAGH